MPLLRMSYGFGYLSDTIEMIVFNCKFSGLFLKILPPVFFIVFYRSGRSAPQSTLAAVPRLLDHKTTPVNPLRVLPVFDIDIIM